jgi:hypothetical protein
VILSCRLFTEESDVSNVYAMYRIKLNKHDLYESRLCLHKLLLWLSVDRKAFICHVILKSSCSAQTEKKIQNVKGTKI